MSDSGKNSSSAEDHNAGRLIVEMDTHLGYQLRRTYGAVRKNLIRIFGDEGLAPGQFSILMLIAANPGYTQTAISELARLDRSTIVPTISHLEKIGFVERQKSKTDARAHAVYITGKGQTALGVIAPKLKVSEDRLTADLSESEKQELIVVLRNIEKLALMQEEEL